MDRRGAGDMRDDDEPLGALRSAPDDPLGVLKTTLREAMARRRLQVGQLERRSGLKHTTVSQALNGRKVPSAATVRALARALDLPADDLLALRERALRGAAPGVDGCPYPGMAAFGADRAELFFGRDELIARLVGALDRRARSGGIQLVIGASGAGKSSLLRAGLVPRLLAGALPTEGLPPVPVVLTPTAEPGAVLDRYREERDRAPDARHVLVVDQFEELFTECRAEAERRRFIDALTRLATPGADGTPPAALVVVGLRADFYAPFLAHPALLAASDEPLTVGPMTPAQLRDAITGPAAGARPRLRLDGGLVERLLADLGTRFDAPPAPGGHDDRDGYGGYGGDDGYDAGRLPLLAHALRATWTVRTGDTLTLKGYETTGGILGAVQRSADRVWERLDGPAREEADALFRRLVRVGRGEADTRRRVTRDTLFAASGRPEVLAGVVDAFVAERLLTQYQDTVEITHEVLLRAWPRLRDWAQEERARDLVHQKLEDDAAVWHRRDRDPALLYRGSVLRTAEDSVPGRRRKTPAPEGRPPSPSSWGPGSPVARDFLAAAVRLRRRSLVLRRGAVALLSVLALLATSAAVYALRQRTAAQDERDRALAARIAFEADRVRAADMSLAAQLDAAAHRLDPAEDTWAEVVSAAANPLSEPLPWQLSREDMVAFGADSTTLHGFEALPLADDTTVATWRIGEERPGRGLTATLPRDWRPVRWMSVSPAVPVMAVRDDRGRTGLWDTRDPARPRLLTLLDPAVVAVEFAPDGAVMATVADVGGDAGQLSNVDETRVRVWDIADPARPRPLTPSFGAPGTAIDTVSLANGGRTLATGALREASGIQLWRVGPKSPDTPPEPVGKPFAKGANTFRLRPDARAVAVLAGHRASVWRLDDGPPTATVLGNPPANVGALAYNRDGTRLATAYTDRPEVQLWNGDVSHLEAVGPPLTGHTTPVAALAFAPDGTSLATMDEETVRLWRFPASTPVTADVFSDGGTLAYRRDGDLLLLKVLGERLQLWDTSAPLRPRRLAELDAPYLADGVFGPDDRTLITYDGLGEVAFWDIGTPSAPRPTGTAFRPGEGEVTSFALSPDGRLLAVAVDEGVALWDVGDPGQPRHTGTLKESGAVTGLLFTPDGRGLLTLGDTSGADLWDVRNPTSPPSEERATTDTVTTYDSAAFATDTRVLLTGLSSTVLGGSVWIWDTARPAGPDNPQEIPTGQTGPVDFVAVQPGTGVVATAAQYGSVRLWHLEDTRLRPRGGPLTGHGPSAPPVFAPDEPVLTIGPRGGTLLLWPLDIADATHQVCAASAGALGVEEWGAVLPEMDYASACD
ncbi:helix-turn-helix domain-containing protein [Streptomyces sp. NPDC004610]|uniref:nSTAND1 domain-containing NTPase n=1 Tax=unclassified Streptomyces TaxID=2593676 RepID=UPI0033B7491A